MSSFGDYVDEELAQISSVIINYNVILPKSWRGNAAKRKFFTDLNGNILFSEKKEKSKSFLPIPTLNDLFDKHQEIIVAPLIPPKGEAVYFPPNVKDGLYSVLINDRRVRALVATNHSGIRFVVARPFDLMEAIVSRALLSSFVEFLLLIALYVPSVIVFVNIMFIPVNRLAKELNSRKESDLTPVEKDKLPSELDAFIGAINNLFDKTHGALQNERRFIADAAHEMRTPLTAISLQAQSLDLSLIPADEAEKIEQLKLAISRQRKLTNDLLEYARSQCGRELKLVSFDLKTLFIEVIDEIGYIADEKDIDLGLVGNCSLTLYTDRSKLKQIILNLVSNALKYTPNGGVCDILCQKNGTVVSIIIKDSGPGISEKSLNKVFNAFYRIGGDTAKIEGTGLGLAIVKSLCDEISATIKLKNQHNSGLMATVSLCQYYKTYD